MLCLLLFGLAAVSSVRSLTVHLVPHTHDDVGWLNTVSHTLLHLSLSTRALRTPLALC